MIKVGIGEVNPHTLEQLMTEIRAGRVAGFTGRIGYVYSGEESWYQDSNLGPCACVEGSNGYFYAERC